jgi:protein-arginine kinase activator protein McsA
MINEREANQETIDKLEKELKEVIDQSNFERAIEIREELKKLNK